MAKEKKETAAAKPEVLSKSELVSIVDEVRSVLDAQAKLEANKTAKLAKAHDGEDTSAEVPPDDSATSDGGDASDGSPAADASSAPPADASSAPPADDGSGAPPADASAGVPDADGDADGSAPPSVEELEQAYAALPLHELQLHYLAAKSALQQAMVPQGADDGSGAPPADASAGAPPAPPPPAADAGGPPAAMKSESGTEMPSDEKANGENPLHAVHKAEKDAEVEALKKRLDEQEQVLGTAVEAMRGFLERPMRKSIVSTADLESAKKSAKPDLDSLTKKEIDSVLKGIVRKPLAKAEREAITGFALGTVKVDGIRAIVEKYS